MTQPTVEIESFARYNYSHAHTVSIVVAHCVCTGLVGQVLHSVSQNEINLLSTSLHTTKLIILLVKYSLIKEHMEDNLGR